jgi:hypothetical protein
MMPIDGRSTGARPCAKAVLALFGGLFLIALLAVPVVTMITAERQSPGSRVVYRITYPKRSTMFLPSYLAGQGRPGPAGEVRLRTAKWTGTMAIVAVLGIFDYFVVCRLLRRRAGRGSAGADPEAIDRKTASGRSGLDIFP